MALLANIYHKKPSSTSSTTKTKTFAETIHNVCDIPTSHLPKLVIKGDKIAITITKDEYLAGHEACKHNLHARIIWPKGTTPLRVSVLRNKLSPQWKDLGKWGITSLGKGFYEFSFSTIEDS
ncbi:unnamed protein product [Lathyrus sativus]|nr:unnamed protein product [Lathyrus sativus]